MAILSNLVKTVAAVSGVERERVGAIARAIREAGLITTRGRGPSAAQMSSSDGANLVIAVNTAETARSAPAMVRRFRTLRTNNRNPSEFGRVLDELITASTKDRLVDYLLDQGFGPVGIECDKRRQALEKPYIRIEFHHERPMAVIECRLPTSAMPKPIPFFPTREKRVVHTNVDRRTTTEITHETILAIAETLRG